MSVFGWIIIHQHLGYTFDWQLPWADYKAGFGSIDADFWLGLERMHLLTSSQPYRLRVELQSWSTNLWFSAEYWSFQIGDEYWSFKIGDQYWSFKIGDDLNDKYRLEVSGYSGDAGDSLLYEGDLDGNGEFGYYYHNGMKFSTFDLDNDEYDDGNCAPDRGGGWWYNGCYWGCLTCGSGDYQWTWATYQGTWYVVNSRMMIKPQ